MLSSLFNRDETPAQIVGSLHYLVVDSSKRDGEGHLGISLKRPPSAALLRQCRRYREAGVLLMLEAKVHQDKRWAAVVDGYRMILADNPGLETMPEINLAAKRLAWIRLQTEKTANMPDYQEWGLSWLTDVGHGDEDNWVTQGMVVSKWEMYLQMLFVITKAKRLVIP